VNGHRRTRDPNLSLWQSAVAQVVLETSAKNGRSLTQNALLYHPMVRATNDFVRAHEATQELVFSAQQLTDEHTRNTHFSSLCFAIAEARAGTSRTSGGAAPVVSALQ
jgi:Tfp pilus assembly protein FimT